IWVLEFAQSEARRPDPLMGWTGSGDTQAQVKLTFPSKKAAKAYAEKHGIAARVYASPAKTLKLQAYADNFK
ncbi:MAG: NADH dehydrogenase ubiquinone Fe-S protein 4, partial [Pseudomonadota bacterium]